jgi:hypothetical protein
MSRAKALVSAHDATTLDSLMRDPRVTRITWRKRPDVQLLLDSLYNLRRSLAGTPEAAKLRQPSGNNRALLILVDRLSDTTAAAEVRRRASQSPSDVIMLPRRGATLGAFAAAVRALTRLRSSDGAQPPRDLRVMVHGELHPRAWSTNGLNEQATADLERLHAAAPAPMPGLGVVQAVTIFLASP